MSSGKKSSCAINNPNSVTYTLSSRAKHLRITLRPDRTITVTIPRNTSLQEARKFLQSKKDWIEKQLEKMDRRQQILLDPDVKTMDLNQAQDDLFERLADFSRKYSLPYQKVTFKCQKTKWASCSGKNNINLNINLVFLPCHLQNYILLHELVHIEVKNHSRNFWKRLNNYCDGRARELAKELKQYNMKLQV